MIVLVQQATIVVFVLIHSYGFFTYKSLRREQPMCLYRHQGPDKYILHINA